MFFTFICGVVRVILFVINGNTHYGDKERLSKDQSYVLIAPHRTRWEPLYLAVAGSLRKFNFMVKKGLFKNPVLRLILKHANAFPVDRGKPGSNAIKTSVKISENSDLNLVMFPGDTRHSSELEGGVALIAKMGRVLIVPSVYQSPLTLKELSKRKKITVRFGDPIDIDDIKKMDKDGLAEAERRMQETFSQLDKEIDPTLKYDSTEKE